MHATHSETFSKFRLNQFFTLGSIEILRKTKWGVSQNLTLHIRKGAWPIKKILRWGVKGTSQLRPRNPGFLHVEKGGASTWKKPKTSQLRPRTSGFFHVEKGGASTWKKPKFYPSVFQPISTNQPTVLVDIWSNSVCWVSYGTRCGPQEAIDFHIRILFQKKRWRHFRFPLQLFQNIFDVFRETCCHFVTWWSMSKTSERPDLCTSRHPIFIFKYGFWQNFSRISKRNFVPFDWLIDWFEYSMTKFHINSPQTEPDTVAIKIDEAKAINWNPACNNWLRPMPGLRFG